MIGVSYENIPSRDINMLGAVQNISLRFHRRLVGVQIKRVDGVEIILIVRQIEVINIGRETAAVLRTIRQPPSTKRGTILSPRT